MRYWLAVLLFCVIGTQFSAVNVRISDAAEQCNAFDKMFAHCGSDARAYKSVAVAIHGWGGHCDSTFGDGDTIFDHLLNGGISDVDCFEYETKAQDIHVSVAQLRQRLMKLQAEGYGEFQFITHSMGGVVLLRLLLDDYLTDDRTALRAPEDPNRFFMPDGASLAYASIWAAPVNGVKPDVEMSLKLAKWFGAISGDSRKALARDGEFVATLHRDLDTLATLLTQASPAVRAQYPLRIYLYHGQGNDWVVEPIDPQVNWIRLLGPGRIEPIHTETGHVQNVGNPGPTDMPRFPIKLIGDDQLLGAQFLPRLEDIFLKDVSSIADSTIAKRRRVVASAVLFLRKRFSDSASALSSLIRTMLKSGYLHDATSDEEMAKGLLDATEEVAAEAANAFAKAEQFVGFADTFVCDGKLDGYDPAAASPTDPGNTRATTATRYVKLLNFLADKTRLLVEAQPQLRARLHLCGDVRGLQVRTAAINVKGLAATNDQPVAQALSGLRALVPHMSEADVMQLDVVNAAIDFRLQRPGGLPQAMAEDVSQIVIASAGLSDLQRTRVMSRLTQVGPDQTSPVLASILTGEQAAQLVAKIDSSRATLEELNFASRATPYIARVTGSSELVESSGTILLDGAATKALDERRIILNGFDTREIAPRFPGVTQRLNQRILDLQR